MMESMSNRLARSARLLCLSASGVAMLAAAPAMAQVTEIVVTAQKTEQNLQDVPISVTALTGDQLATSGTRSLEEITRLVPSVTIRKGTTSANSAIVMRGVGTITFSVAAEPSVSTVVDGVVLSRSGQSFLDLVDIDRIEVLRGPQGTLFGKNASAGLVNIVSRGGTDRFEFEGNLSAYTGSEYIARASISGPLGEGLSGRFTGFFGSFDGNITNIFGGRRTQVNGYEHWGVRGLLDYDRDGSRLRFILDYFEGNDDCCAEVTGVSRGAILDAELGITPRGEETRLVNQNLVTRTLDRQWSATLNGDFDVFSSHTLSVILGYRNWRNTELREGDFLPRATTTAGQLHDRGVVETDQFSSELRLASDQNQTIAYQVGGFAWYSKNSQDFTRSNIECTTSTLAIDPATGARPCNLTDLVNTRFPTATSRSDVEVHNYALFGQVTWNITESLRLIGGLRWTHDSLTYVHTRAPGVNAANGTPATGAGVSGNPAGGTIAAGGNGTNVSRGFSSTDNLSGRAVIQFDVTDDVMLYGSFTRGYKGPAFNVFFNHTRPTNSVPIDAETSDSWEIGFKSQFADRRVRLNGSLFTVTYNGFQANNFVLLNGAVVTNLTNAGTVRSRGFELEAVVAPIDGLTLSANLAYADARVRRFNPNPLTNAPDARNGTRLPLAPEFSYNLAANYESGDLGGFKLYLGTDWRHTSSQFSDLGQGGPIAPYGIWNANIGISDPDDRFRLSLMVRNILDESYVMLNTSNGQRLLIARDADRYAGVNFRVRLGDGR